MTFFSQFDPDITESIPTPLSSGGQKAQAFHADDRFDCSINGMAFNFRIRSDMERFWYQRASSTPTKPQIDTNVYAGEASLSDFWIRSQTSWHNGAGVKYYGQGDDEHSDWRYGDSQGIDPWDEGEFKLLKDADFWWTSSGDHWLSTYIRDGQHDGVVVGRANPDSADLWHDTDGNPPGSIERKNLSWDPELKDSRIGTAPGDGGTSSVQMSGGPAGRTWACRTQTNGAIWGTLHNANDRGDGGAAYGYPSSSVQPGDRLAVSGFVAHNEAEVDVVANVWLRFRDASGTSVASVRVVDGQKIAPGPWTRVGGVLTVPAEVADAEWMHIDIQLMTTEMTQASSWAGWGAFLCEKADNILPFFSGADADTSTASYSWDGATDGSASTAVIQYQGSGRYNAIRVTGADMTQPVVVGDHVWFGNSTGVHRWDVQNSTVQRHYTSNSPCRCWWVKSRLFVASGKDMFWLPSDGLGEVETAGLLVASGPTDAWRWTDVSQTADAILLSGHDGVRSAIFTVTLESTDSALPTFTGAREVAEMPPGETINAMFAYLSSYVVLGTSHGVRVGLVGEQGRVQYGPLTIESEWGAQDVSCRDRFAYVAMTRALPDGTTGLARVDLSAPIGDTGRHAWAWDVTSAEFREASSVAFWGRTDRAALGCWNHYGIQHPDRFVPEGWLDTGKIRFATGEPKDFQKLRVSGDVNGGRVDVMATALDRESLVARCTPDSGMQGELSLGLPGGPLFTELGGRLVLHPKSATVRQNLHRAPRLSFSAQSWSWTGNASGHDEISASAGVLQGLAFRPLEGGAGGASDVSFLAGNADTTASAQTVPGTKYVVSLHARHTIPGGAEFTITPWHRGEDGEVYAGETGDPVPVTAGVWSRLWKVVEAEGDQLGFSVNLVGGLPEGQQLVFSCAMVEQGELLGDYFDGGTFHTVDGTAAWDGQPYNSASTAWLSELEFPRDRRNLLPNPRQAWTAGEYSARWPYGTGSGTTAYLNGSGIQPLNFVRRTWTTGHSDGESTFNLSLWGSLGVPVSPGAGHTATVRLRRGDGSEAVSAKLAIDWYDSDSNLIDVSETAETPVDTDWTMLHLETYSPHLGSVQARYCRLRVVWVGEPSDGDVWELAGVTLEDREIPVAMFDVGDVYFDGNRPDTADWAFSWDGGRRDGTSVAARVGMVETAYNTPVIESVTVKATPAPRKAREVRFPLACYDVETTRTGETVGYPGFAIDRIQELEALDVGHAPVFVVDRRTGEAFTGTITGLEFLGSASPDKAHDSVGGMFNVTVRARE